MKFNDIVEKLSTFLYLFYKFYHNNVKPNFQLFLLGFMKSVPFETILDVWDDLEVR